MCQQSRIAFVLLLVGITVSSIGAQSAVHGQSSPAPQVASQVDPRPPALSASAVTSAVECAPHYEGRYPSHQCFVEIKRESPTSPLPVMVPKGTSVVIRISNTRPLETIAFDEKSTRIERPDAFSTFVQAALDPLKSLVMKTVKAPGSEYAMREELVEVDDPLYKRQVEVQKKIDIARTFVATAAKRIVCMSAYQPTVKSGIVEVCDTATSLNRASFDAARRLAICDIQGGEGCPPLSLRAGLTPLPIASEQATAGQIAKGMGDLAKGAVDLEPGKRDAYDQLITNEQRLVAEIKELQEGQTALLKSAAILNSLPASFNTEITRSQDRDSSSTVTVTATDQISKTPVQLGVITITWQTAAWKISTGILFSALPAHSFTNAPQIINGQPILDSSGKLTTIVTDTVTHPTVVFPLVLANYRFAQARSCSRSCGLFGSGGVGVNLANSTTEFAGGVSFQWGSVLLSPLVHIGRVQSLTDGVQVGQTLGSSPPDLPIEKRWSVSGGLGISYILPFK